MFTKQNGRHETDTQSVGNQNSRYIDLRNTVHHVRHRAIFLLYLLKFAFINCLSLPYILMEFENSVKKENIRHQD